MLYRILPVIACFFLSFTTNPTATKKATVAVASKSGFESRAASVYHSLHSDKILTMPSLDCFSKALRGFYALKEQGSVTKDILTVVDFTLSSNTKRLWVIDLATNTVLVHSLVAHGRNTGDEFAQSFSNANESNMSSLGFYATGEIYNGKHGISLKLDGLERGINDNARARGVVMHAADYVSESFIRNHKRLGRSQGCPALPPAITREVIDIIKNKSCLFIYHPSMKYKMMTHLLS